MDYIKRLKNKNILEKIGFLYKNNPKKAYGILFSLISIVVLISLTPWFYFLFQKNTAYAYIQNSYKSVNELVDNNNHVNDLLNKNKEIYKDWKYYLDLTKDFSNDNKQLENELEELNLMYEENNISNILYCFNKENSDNFTLKINTVKEKYNTLINEVVYIKETSDYLIKSYVTLLDYKNNHHIPMEDLEDKFAKIKLNAKTKQVTDRSSKLLDTFKNKNNNLLGSISETNSFTKNDLGVFNYKELVEIHSTYRNLMSDYNSVLLSKSSFLSYWDELQVQYYTKVVKHYYTRHDDYVSERNPNYREWTETETYQDTETYTEREYVGSRIVGDQKEDIYETVTKTRPVTKTMTVTKDNGQPRTISVRYDLYKHYYTLETTTQTGTNKENIYVGSKHEKYDSFIRGWNYDSDQEINYVEWKQLWNDNSDIKKGTNIKPYIEP